MKVFTRNVVLVSIVATIPLFNCVRHTPPPPAQLMERNYIDIQPGWRLRVIIPILASGDYKVALEQTPGPGGDLTFKTGDGFEGYEIDNYTVALHEGKITIQFASGVLKKTDGTIVRQTEPRISLFAVNPEDRVARLLFLTRQSDNDHNEAFIVSNSLAGLEALTRIVEAKPRDNCKTQNSGTCSWIPQGIAIQPQKRAKGGAWVPAV